MDKGHFLSTLEVERMLEKKPALLRDIALELRSLVVAAAPQACERVSWGGLTYYDSRRGGPVRGGICQIEVHADHVRLSFIHGIHLPDPEGILQGNRLSKRYVRIASYVSAPWEALERLIEAAASFDPATTISEQ
jgi:hypothetical protein